MVYGACIWVQVDVLCLHNEVSFILSQDFFQYLPRLVSRGQKLYVTAQGRLSRCTTGNLDDSDLEWLQRIFCQILLKHRILDAANDSKFMFEHEHHRGALPFGLHEPQAVTWVDDFEKILPGGAICVVECHS